MFTSGPLTDGADAEVRGKYGQTPLIMAVASCETTILRLLLAQRVVRRLLAVERVNSDPIESMHTPLC